MKALKLLAKALLIIGLIGMFSGAFFHNIIGSIIILCGCGLASLGTMLIPSNKNMLIYISFTLLLIGITLLFMIMPRGIENIFSLSFKYLIVILPYPIGWILGVVAIIRKLLDLFNKSY